VREIGLQNQTIWFDFASGKETYIVVHFNSWERISDSSLTPYPVSPGIHPFSFRFGSGSRGSIFGN
jgi:hypothetical protein